MNKKYLIALIVVVLFATASVSASTAFKRLTATERPDYKLVINNEAVELKNNPITIDGVTYLPLREVATILDQDVNFDKGTITLDSKKINYESERDKVTAPITNDKTETTVTIGTEFKLDDVFMTINSVKYTDSIVNKNGSEYVAKDGEKLFLINFDVLITSEPTNRFEWDASEFISSVVVGDKKLTSSIRSVNSTNIKPNEKTNIEMYISIPKDSSVSYVLLKNPKDYFNLARLDINN